MTTTLNNYAAPLIKAGRRAYLASLGLAAVAEAQAKRSIDALAERGEAAAGRQKPAVFDKFKRAGDKLGEQTRARFNGVVRLLGAPTRDEVNQLVASVERLTEKLKTLEPAK